MKILTFGQTGQLAKAIKRTQPKAVKLIQLNHQQLDVTQPNQIYAALELHKPDIIINCAAFTHVDNAEKLPEQAININSVAVEHMAKAADFFDIKLIQLSSDYVFDGHKNAPYTVTDLPNPINAYGRSKQLAENTILDYHTSSFTLVRTSWLYHHSGHNFVTSMLNLMLKTNVQHAVGARPDNPIKVVNDQMGRPTMVDDLAHFLWQLCSQPKWSAIYHWSDAGTCTWYEFAQEIKTQGIALGLLAHPIHIQSIMSEQYPSSVKRPKFSVLDTHLSQSIASSKPWQQQLSLCLKQFQHEQKLNTKA